MCELTLNIFSGKTISIIMKKWHSGVENGDILNPALYKHHHMKTRWSSNSLVQRGRSGALSVTLSAALRVRGKPLNEVGQQSVRQSVLIIKISVSWNNTLKSE